MGETVKFLLLQSCLMRPLPLLCLAWLTSSILSAQNSWNRITAPVTDNLWGICYEAGQYVVVGESGTILTSPDGAAWTSRTSGTNVWLTAVCFGNGLYVAVGGEGTILTSIDARSWITRSTTGERLNGVAFGGGRFIAVGENGTVRSSTDAITWTTKKLPVDSWLRAICYGQDSFLIGGGEGILCSTDDGLTFRLVAPTGAMQSTEAFFYTNGITAGAGGNYSAVIATADRMVWEPHGSHEGYFRGITKNGAMLLAVGNAGAVYSRSFGLRNDSATFRFNLGSANLNAVTVGPSGTVIVGDMGVIYAALSSPVAPTVANAMITPAVAYVGGAIRLSAEVSGSPPYAFEWKRRGLTIAEAITDTLVLDRLTPADAGDYALTVRNLAGSAAVSFVVPTPIRAPSSLVDPQFTSQWTPATSLSEIVPLADGKSLVGRSGDYGGATHLFRFNGDGSWDLSFQSPVRWGYVVPASDGRVLVRRAGQDLTRLLRDGSIDTSFSASSDYGWPIVLHDGKIVCISITSLGVATLTRLNSDGSVDSSYPATSLNFDDSAATLIQPWFDQIISTEGVAGEIMVAAVSRQVVGTGYFGVNQTRLFRLQPDGTRDGSFIPVTIGEAFTQLAGVRDKLHYRAFSQTGSLGSTLHERFARLNRDGSPDHSYTPVLFTFGMSPRPFVLHDDGSIFTVENDRLIRYTSEGFLSTAFNGQLAPNAGGKISRLIALPNGGLLAAGLFSSFNGSPTAGLARLTVISHDPTTHLANLSIRTTAGTGDRTLIAGFVVSGQAGSHSVFVRGVGPGLVPLGISSRDVIADPRITLFEGSSVVASDDDWNAGLEQTANALGAYPLPHGSRDAALVAALSPGAYTLQLTQSNGSAPGLALVELYHAGPAPASDLDPRLVNLSGRAHVGAGDNVLIAGFVLAGTSTKRLLIRAIGPGLRSHGVSDFLSDPELLVHRGTEVVAANDNWSGTDGVFSAVGAFALDVASRDAALVFDATPGVYTVVVRGVAGSNGSALVEIYEVP
jgi:hypothetical protein